jgi:hypothetical protein
MSYKYLFYNSHDQLRLSISFHFIRHKVQSSNSVRLHKSSQFIIQLLKINKQSIFTHIIIHIKNLPKAIH